MTRVVITGIGACTSVGDDSAACFNSFVSGIKGNAPLKHLEAGRYNKPIAYEREELATDDGRARSSSFLVRAIQEAIDELGDIAEENIPVYVGTGLRELRSLEVAALQNKSIEVSELDFRGAVNQVLPNSKKVYTLSNACAASSYALAMAFDQIAMGKTDIAVVAGCDTLTSSMFGLLDRVNPNVPEAVQVFDKSRKGVLMGDGGVAIVIERLESALERQHFPLAEIKGVGLSTDAVHETAPDQEGIERAINQAFDISGMKPQDIDVIYVHGTGTELNDAVESVALEHVYAQVTEKPVISGIKAMTGHTSGASGCIGVMAAVESILNAVIPPTPGTDNVLDSAGQFPIYSEAHKAPVKNVQVNAFGFGGVNSVVLVSAYEGVQYG